MALPLEVRKNKKRIFLANEPPNQYPIIFFLKSRKTSGIFQKVIYDLLCQNLMSEIFRLFRNFRFPNP